VENCWNNIESGIYHELLEAPLPTVKVW
jgi:hypothetical protein